MPAADAPDSGDRRNGSKYARRVATDRRRVTDEAARKHTGAATFPGCDIVGDDLEFIKAMDRWKREHRRPFPTCGDVLTVVKALGYRKVAAADTTETLET